MRPLEFATVSPLDKLRFLSRYILPAYVSGTFIRCPFWVAAVARLPWETGARFVLRLRERYPGGGVYVRGGRAKTLLLFDQGAIAEVLDGSPDRFVSGSAKHKGMSHFQPEAVAVSRGEDWSVKRGWNTDVLQSLRGPDGPGAMLRRTVTDAADAAIEGKSQIDWNDLERFTRRIASQVLFGYDRPELFVTLRALMNEANRLFALRRTRRRSTFFRDVEDACANAPADSLAGLARRRHGGVVAGQLPHWMFALSTTLAENLARTLVVAFGDKTLHGRLQREVARQVDQSAHALDQLELFRGTVREALRLWPTTPVLTRQAANDEVVAGYAVPAGTTVFVPNDALHRDPRMFEDVDFVRPERWGAPTAAGFLHFGAGAQACPGRELATDVLQLVLARWLSSGKMRLVRPEWPASRRARAHFNAFEIRMALDQTRPRTEATRQ